MNGYVRVVRAHIKVAHRIGEHVSVEELSKAADILARAIERSCGLQVARPRSLAHVASLHRGQEPVETTIPAGDGEFTDRALVE